MRGFQLCDLIANKCKKNLPV